ncbi:hypothetical protein BDV11DRAFT_210176 [Aspergillus similis]
MRGFDDSAAGQPENEIQSIGPQTPPAKNCGPRQIEFQKYKSPRARTTHNEVKMVNDEVNAKLTRRFTNVEEKANHLYVFSSPETKGHYKVGRGKKLERPTKGQEKCYPKHELHCYIECPNADLFEFVVHAEFLLSRRTHKCNRCEEKEVTHKEWIEAPLQDILDSVTAWSMYARWLYQQMEVLGFGRGHTMDEEFPGSYGSHFQEMPAGTER